MGVANAAHEDGAVGGVGAPRAGHPERHVVTGTLVDSLLHDARNPLNALSIHLEVLTGKLRDADGEVPPAQEKNLRAMREQITRMDVLLKHFGEFLAPRAALASPLDLSELTQRAIQVVGYTARAQRLSLEMEVERDLWLPSAEQAGVRYLVLGVLLRCIRGAGPGTELTVKLSREGKSAVLLVVAQGDSPRMGAGEAEAALARAEAERLGVALILREDAAQLTFELG